MTTLKCNICNTVLIGKQKRFCSNKCRTKSWLTTRKNKKIATIQKLALKCLYCDNDLIGQQKKFCSGKCSNKVLRSLKKFCTIKPPMVKCSVCENYLPLLRKKHCSVLCSLKYKARSGLKKELKHKTGRPKKGINHNPNRAKEVRIKLVNMLGGSCQSCGYCKNYSALCFHHKDPNTKLFGINIVSCFSTSWESLVQEALKCSLLCANCHAEEHHPQFSMP